MSNSRGRLLVAFALVYVLWGSTYLGIRFAIETLPPFVMAGTRFVVAGAFLYIWARMRGEPRPTRVNWIAAAIIGALLLVGGNGGVVLAEQRVPSGLAAVLVGTEPLWIVLMDWARPNGTRPTATLLFGILSGFLGVVLLVTPGHFGGGSGVDLLGASLIVGASLSWAVGSLYTSRGARLPASPALATGMEMLVGGTVLLVIGSVLGEWSRLTPAAISLKSVLALGYLIVFGAIVGFTAYVYLLQNTTPSRASTYAFVNPVIAVLVGWAIGGEALTARTILATAAIVVAVVMITVGRAVSHQPSAVTGEFPVVAHDDPALQPGVTSTAQPLARSEPPIRANSGDERGRLQDRRLSTG